MRKLWILAAGFAAMASAALAGDAVEGVWKTKPDDNGNFGYIKIAACGDAVCGVLIKSFDSAGAPMKSDHIGKKIIWDMIPQGDGRYTDGKIWAPDRDKTYDSKMTLSGDSLAVEGCILFICRDGGTWTRIK